MQAANKLGVDFVALGKRFRILATFADLVSFQPGHIEDVGQRFELVRLGTPPIPARESQYNVRRPAPRSAYRRPYLSWAVPAWGGRG